MFQYVEMPQGHNKVTSLEDFQSISMLESSLLQCSAAQAQKESVVTDDKTENAFLKHPFRQ